MSAALSVTPLCSAALLPLLPCCDGDARAIASPIAEVGGHPNKIEKMTREHADSHDAVSTAASTPTAASCGKVNGGMKPGLVGKLSTERPSAVLPPSWEPNPSAPTFQPRKAASQPPTTWAPNVSAPVFEPTAAWAPRVAAAEFVPVSRKHNMNRVIGPPPAPSTVTLSLEGILATSPQLPPSKPPAPLPANTGALDSPRTSILAMCGAFGALANSGAPPHPPPPPPLVTPPAQAQSRRQRLFTPPPPVQPPTRSELAKLSGAAPGVYTKNMPDWLLPAPLPPQARTQAIRDGHKMPECLQPIAHQEAPQLTLEQYFAATSAPTGDFGGYPPGLAAVSW